MFRFASPEFLLILALVPLLAGAFWVAARRRRVLLERFGEAELVKKLTASVSQRARLIKAGLILADLVEPGAEPLHDSGVDPVVDRMADHLARRHVHTRLHDAPP